MGSSGSGTWYRGSQRVLESIRSGSSITQHVAIARAFHRPGLVGSSGPEDVQHDGSSPGHLYAVDEKVRPHPVNAGRWEWPVRREMRVRLVGRTEVQERERLTSAHLAELRRAPADRAGQAFADAEGRGDDRPAPAQTGCVCDTGNSARRHGSGPSSPATG
jgi:hypothetical protein